MKTIKDWSIELGYMGEINQSFEEKLKSVKKVRRKLQLELIISIICFIIFTVVMTITLNVWITVLSCAYLFFIYKNIKIWIEIKNIREQRYNDYNRAKENGLSINYVNIDR
jgi:hypothetical protein